MTCGSSSNLTSFAPGNRVDSDLSYVSFDMMPRWAIRPGDSMCMDVRRVPAGVGWARQAARRSPNWSQRGEEWSVAWGTSEAQWFGCLLPRLRQFLPSHNVVEIAPGHGRWTRFLTRMCSQYYGVDVSSTCIEFCQSKFTDTNVKVFVNDGMDLSMIGDNTIDVVFSFDSLEHVEKEVLEAYIPQILGKLRKQGVAFIHHSNMKALGELNVGDRARSVDASVVHEIVETSGAHVMRQEIIKWDSFAGLDCLTMFSRQGDYDGDATTVINNDFMTEAANIRTYIAPWSFAKQGTELTILRVYPWRI